MKPINQDSFFRFALAAIVVLGGVLRFYDLTGISQIVFDEIHFAHYGYDYLVGTKFTHVHPPLYNYLSAASIWLYYHLPGLGSPAFTGLKFEQLDVLSFRWINALSGTALPLLVGLFVRQITQQRLVALLATLFVAIDGSLVVDSRFALNNIFLPCFGFLACWCAYRGFTSRRNPGAWLLATGLSLGCLISVKWNGLGYLLALGTLLAGLHWVRATDRFRPALPCVTAGVPSSAPSVNPSGLWFYLLVVPLLVYGLLWIPDLMFNQTHSIVAAHQQILAYHLNEVGADAHPYCSRWYNWPLMGRPISYHFAVRDAVESTGLTKKYYTDVHLFGNPALYWLSFASILFLLVQWWRQSINWLRTGSSSRPWLVTSVILFGYGANLMPWALVHRCAFLYHYQSASIFGFIALAWLCSQALLAPRWWLKSLGVLVMLAVVAAFIYWLPFALGLELSVDEFYGRMWLTRWI